MAISDKNFAHIITVWQKACGRHHLPWQVRDPYCVWLSEIMLQQTQVATVIPYYQRFLERFPDIASLAKAQEDEVLALWSGLGYYSRARNLHHCAQTIMRDFNGELPQKRCELETLKGIGRSTAAAIAVFAFGAPEAILDGNVRRLLARVFYLKGAKIDARWWQKAEAIVHQASDVRAYTQGLMDFGSMICTRTKPKCDQCPLAKHCLALQYDCVKDLPEKAQKKKTPERSAHFALIRSRDEAVFLYKRREKGVWYQLWCLPEFASQSALRAFAKENGLQVADTPITLKHRFTHYTIIMHIHPLRCVGNFNDDSGAFFSDPLALALPTPVRQILV